MSAQRYGIRAPERPVDWERSTLVFGPRASIRDASTEDMIEEPTANREKSKKLF